MSSTDGAAGEPVRGGVYTELVWEDDHMPRWIFNRVPVERPGLPRELVGACLLLASDAGSFLTGQTLVVDGGASAGVPPRL